MNRRMFMRTTALVGVAATSSHLSRLWATASPLVEGDPWLSVAGRDDSSPELDQDPMTILRSTLVVDGMDASALNEQYLAMLRTGGVTCWHKNMGGIQSFADTYSFLDRHSNDIVPAVTARDIRKAYQQGKLALVFGWKTAAVLGNPIEPPRTPLRAYYQLGLRICGIAFNVATFFGGGNLERQFELTRAGQRLVEEIHQLRIILDVGGPTGEQTSLEAIQMSSGIPVISSNTNVAALNDNPRCISIRLIEAIAKSGGVIGLTAMSDYIMRSRRDAHILQSPQAPLEKYLDQFDYIRRLVGVDHVGLAPDFVEGRGGFTQASRNPMLYPTETMGEWPFQYVKGFESIIELPNVVRGLVKRGWSLDEIRKVLGENWLRVYGAVWGA